MNVKVCKLKEIVLNDGTKLVVGTDTVGAKLPVYGKEGDACMDIYPIYSEYDVERDRWIYHTGLAFAIGDSVIRIPNDSDSKTVIAKDKFVPNEMELRPRSNLTKSDFYVPNAPGTLDWGYRGELLMVFKNRTSIEIRNALSYLTTAIEKLAPKVGANGEIKQYTSQVRHAVNKLNNSITNPPYKCDGVDRCAQLIIRGAERIEWEEVETVEELGATERGKGGFGSTGGAVK